MQSFQEIRVLFGRTIASGLPGPERFVIDQPNIPRDIEDKAGPSVRGKNTKKTLVKMRNQM